VVDLGGALHRFREALAGFDARTLTPRECADLLPHLAAAVKACEAARAAVAARAAGSGEHHREGYAGAPDWLAAVSGLTAHDARLALETVAEVEHHPETRDALFSGHVSMAQAREIARTEAAAPGHEHDCSSSPAVRASIACAPSRGSSVPRRSLQTSSTLGSAKPVRSSTGATSSAWCA